MRLLAALAAAFTLALPSTAAAQQTLIVTSTSDGQVQKCGSDGTCPNLRTALAAAQDGDVIRLPASGTYTQDLGQFMIRTGVALIGAGANRTRIAGGGQTRVFQVGDTEQSQQPEVVLSHLQVADGRNEFDFGGNILNYGHLALDHVRVTGGIAGQGGGIANLGNGTLFATHSLIDHNRAESTDALEIGGGIYSRSFESGAVVLEDSTVAENEAVQAGGIAVFPGEADVENAVVLERVTLARNRAHALAPGGILLDEDVTGLATGSIIAGNTAAPSTLAAFAPTLSNCDVPPPVDGGGNISDTGDCGFATVADPQLSETLVDAGGETPVLTIGEDSPAIGLSRACEGSDQRDVTRPQTACSAGAYQFVAETPAPSPTPTPNAAPFVAPPPPTPPATPTQPPPEPVYRKSVVVKPTKGKVRVKLPGTKRYVDLVALDSIPMGATIDVRTGRVRLYAARNRSGRRQAASFYGGVFRVRQRGRYVELQLRGPKPRCGRRGATAGASSKGHTRKHGKRTHRKARTRRLWGSGRGRFRTRGRFSAATVRGTTWLVEDRCRSTLTRVKHGVVKVRDFRRHRTILLRAGDRYVARRR
jgi:hypothetical protein